MNARLADVVSKAPLRWLFTASYRARVLSERAAVLLERKDATSALAALDDAIALDASNANAHLRRGLALAELGRYEEALRSYDATVAVAPQRGDAYYRRANVLLRLGRQQDALADYGAALRCEPQHANALYNQAVVLHRLGCAGEALHSYERLLELQPDDADAWNSRGNVLQDLHRLPDAAGSYERAIELRPDHADALHNYAAVSLVLNRPARAADAFAKVLKLDPRRDFAKGKLLYAKLLCCDWSHYRELRDSVDRDVRAGKRSVDPFVYQAVSASPGDLRRCAETYAKSMYPATVRQPPADARRADGKIRIGYVSGEFREQATAILMAGLYEHHDCSRFELFAFDNGVDDGSALRQRLLRSFQEVVDISRLDDVHAAAAIRQRGIDILVSLNGYFGYERQGVFACRPAPVQVNYLGFPGTLGTDYIDYIVADARIIPPEHEIHYTEKVAYLPHTYQPNDPRRSISAHTPSRADAGLPERGFVFACFNNSYKITPDVFDIWMRLLARIDGSVLWLYEGSGDASANLRKEAHARGLAPERLVFAPKVKPEDHLARHRLADLFLDTLPVNAHTTASDALWAGLPVLTCEGTAFCGRVATSLLHAVGLPELVTHDLAEYERKAEALAADPSELAEIRQRLVHNRATCALFDIERYTRALEAAFLTMHECVRCHDVPTSFCVSESAISGPGNP